MDREIAQVAARQHGNSTRQQLLAVGLDDDGIAFRVECGRLHRVHRGVYAVGRPPVTPLERAAAAVLACGQGAVLSHHAAMALWGFAKRWPTPLDVTVPGDRRPRGVKVHRTRQPLTNRDRTVQLGIPVTSPARTLLDCAPSLGDAALTRAVNDARLSRYLALPALADVIERCRGHRGASRLARFLASDDEPTRSRFEDTFPNFCERHGLPRPVMNAQVAGYEVDALFEREKVIVELDGWEFHASRAAFEADRDRDADTLAAGYVTVRNTWRRARSAPTREASRLDAILRARRERAA